MKHFKRLSVISFLLLLTCALMVVLSGCATTVKEDDGIAVHKYNERLIKLTVTTPAVFNYLASIGEDGILIVDTGLPQNSEKIRKKLATFSDKQINTVIITHSHGDHIGGLDFLREGAPIFANKITMTDKYYALPEKVRFEEAVFPVEKEETISFNGEAIKMIVPPTGHYKDDMLVFFKESNLWYTGDRLFPGDFPYVDLENGGDIEELIRSYKEIATLSPDAIFVSSHGDDMTAKELEEYTDSLVASIEVIRKSLGDGESVDDMLAAKILSDWDSFADGFTDHEAWIRTVVNFYSGASGRISIAKPLTEVLVDKGIEEMLLHYQELKSNKSEMYNFEEYVLNMMGYQLLGRDMLDEAAAVLKLNIDAYPNSANTYDSYGEVMLTKGDTTTAISFYQKAIEVDSTFDNAKEVLKKLKTGLEQDH